MPEVNPRPEGRRDPPIGEQRRPKGRQLRTCDVEFMTDTVRYQGRQVRLVVVLSLGGFAGRRCPLLRTMMPGGSQASARRGRSAPKSSLGMMLRTGRGKGAV